MNLRESEIYSKLKILVLQSNPSAKHCYCYSFVLSDFKNFPLKRFDCPAQKILNVRLNKISVAPDCPSLYEKSEKMDNRYYIFEYRKNIKVFLIDTEFV